MFIVRERNMLFPSPSIWKSKIINSIAANHLAHSEPSLQTLFIPTACTNCEFRTKYSFRTKWFRTLTALFVTDTIFLHKTCVKSVKWLWEQNNENKSNKFKQNACNLDDIMDVITTVDKKPLTADEEKRKHKLRGRPTILRVNNLTFAAATSKRNVQNKTFCFWFVSAIAFLSTVSGMAAIAGFSRTIATARKQDQKLYEHATVETVNLIEAGTKLATRALAWGTFYAFLGTGTFFYGIWKLSGATNVMIMHWISNLFAWNRTL